MVEWSLKQYVFFILIPFFSFLILNFIWIILVLNFRRKVMKINPELALNILPVLSEIKPQKTFESASKSIWFTFSLGTLSKKRTEKLFNELFKIKDIKKLKNKEFNKDIERLFKLFKIIGLGFWIVVPATILWILLPVFISNIISWVFG